MANEAPGSWWDALNLTGMRALADSEPPADGVTESTDLRIAAGEYWKVKAPARMWAGWYDIFLVNLLTFFFV